MIKFKMDGRDISVKLGDDEYVMVMVNGDDITDQVSDQQYNEYLIEGISIFNLERSEYIAERLM